MGQKHKKPPALLGLGSASWFLGGLAQGFAPSFYSLRGWGHAEDKEEKHDQKYMLLRPYPCHGAGMHAAVREAGC